MVSADWTILGIDNKRRRQGLAPCRHLRRPAPTVHTPLVVVVVGTPATRRVRHTSQARGVTTTDRSARAPVGLKKLGRDDLALL